MVDYEVVRRLHRVVADELADRLRALGPGVDQRAEGSRLAELRVRAYVDDQRRRGHLISDADEQALLEAVIAELAGLGRLQMLLADPTVEDIHILGHDRVRVERSDGSVVDAGPILDKEAR